MDGWLNLRGEERRQEQEQQVENGPLHLVVGTAAFRRVMSDEGDR